MISWREHVEMETEGERSPPAEFTAEQLAEIQRIAAADLVLAMRQVREKSKAWPQEAREAYRMQFQRLAKEFAAAADHLSGLKPDEDFLPTFLQPGIRILSPSELARVRSPGRARVPPQPPVFLVRGLP